MLLDIILIVLGLIALIVGYKVGFLKYVLNLASLFTGLIISLALTKPVAFLISKTPINQFAYDFVYNRLENSDIFVALGHDASIIELLKSLGFSEIFATFLEPIIIAMGYTNDHLLETISTNLSDLAINIGTFFILWIGLALLIWILKMFANMLRKLKFIRVFDSIVGMGFSFAVMVVLCYTVFAGAFYLRKIDSINSAIGPFMREQLQTSFGVYNYFENHNIVIECVELLFTSNN